MKRKTSKKIIRKQTENSQTLGKSIYCFLFDFRVYRSYAEARNAENKLQYLSEIIIILGEKKRTKHTHTQERQRTMEQLLSQTLLLYMNFECEIYGEQQTSRQKQATNRKY